MIGLLEASRGAASCCAFGNDGDLLAVGTMEGAVDVYSAARGRAVFHRRLGRAEIKAVALSDDGRVVLAADADGRFWRWTPGAGSPRALGGEAEAAHAHAALSPDGARGVVAFTSFFHGREGTRLWLLEGGPAGAARTAVLPGVDCGGAWIEPGGTAALVLLDGVLERWEFSLRREKILGGGEQGAVVALDPIERVALRALPGGAAALSDLRGGGERGCSPAALRSPAALWAARGELVRVDREPGSERIVVTRVSLSTGRALATLGLEGFRAFVDPRRPRAIAADFSGGVAVYDLSEGTLSHALCAPPRAWRCAGALGPDDAGVLVTADGHDGVRVHRMNGQNGLLLPRSAGARIDALIVSADGSTAAAVDWAGRVRVWDLARGTCAGVLPLFGPDDCRGLEMPAVVLAADGRHLAESRGVGALYALDAPPERARVGSILPGRAPRAGEPWRARDDEGEGDEGEEDAGDGPVRTAVLLRRIGFEARVTVSPDARYAAVHQRSPGPLHVRDLRPDPTTKPRPPRMLHENAYAAVFDPAWARAAVAEGPALRVLEVDSGRTIARWEAGSAGTAEALAWDARGEFVAAHGGGRDGVLSVWHARTGREVWSFEAGRDAVLLGVGTGGEWAVLLRGARWERVERAGRGGSVALAYLALPCGEFVAARAGRVLISPGAFAVSGAVRDDVVLDPVSMAALVDPDLLGDAGAMVEARDEGERREIELRERLEREVRAARDDARRPVPAAVLRPGESFAGARLASLDLREALFDGADLSGADLSGADLRRASLRRANLSGADLSGARLDGARLRDADLSGARLDGARAWEATLEGARPGVAGGAYPEGWVHPRPAPPGGWGVADVALDPAGARLAVLLRGDDPRVAEVQVFVLGACAPVLAWRAPAAHAWVLRFAPDGARLWALGRAVRAFSAGDGRALGVSEGGDAVEGPWALDPTGVHLARLARAGERVELFDGAAFRWRGSLELGEAARGATLAWGAAGLAVCGERVVHFRADAPADLLRGRPGPDARGEELPACVRAATYAPDGSLRLVDEGGQAYRADAGGVGEPARLGRLTDVNNLDWLALPAGGSQVFACETRPSLWDAATGQWIAVCDAGDVRHFQRAAVSESGRAVVAVAADGSGGAECVRVWDLGAAETWPAGPPLAFARCQLFPAPGAEPGVRLP